MAVEDGFIQTIEELHKPAFASFIRQEKSDRQMARMAKAIKGDN